MFLTLDQCIPAFAETFEKLQNWMNELLKGGERKSRRAKGIKLFWEKEMENAFIAAKDSIQAAVMQAHPNPEYTFVPFTDASDYHWGLFLHK